MKKMHGMNKVYKQMLHQNCEEIDHTYLGT